MSERIYWLFGERRLNMPGHIRETYAQYAEAFGRRTVDLVREAIVDKAQQMRKEMNELEGLDG
jgi:hypothetical protein